MKSILRCASTLLLLVLATTKQGLAVGFTYDYVGSFYATTTGPTLPGFRLSDRITTSFSLDSSLWGTTQNIDYAVLRSGPLVSINFAGNVTTDTFGRVISWGISNSSPGLDLFTSGSVDGSGVDYITGDYYSFPNIDTAIVNYAAGSRTPGNNGWVIESVPDTGSTLLLMGLGLASLGFLRRKRPA